MEILITETQLRRILKEEYSDNVIEQLLNKFASQTNVDRTKISNYIKIFDKIKNGPNIINKDITTYTFPELEEVILSYLKKDKPRSYKGDTSLDLVHLEKGLEIYVADSKEKCIKYGEGYNFCISSRGRDSLYQDYRIDKEGTPYFIFNRNLESSKNPDDADGKTFLDPEHLMVLFVYWPNGESLEEISFQDGEFNENDAFDVYYSITNADNDGEEHYLKYESIEKIYPSLKGLKNVFIPKDLTKNEQQMLDLTRYCNSMLDKINEKYPERGSNEVCPKYEDRVYNLAQLMRLDEFYTLHYLKAYNNKIFKTYVIHGPIIIQNKLNYIQLRRIIGPKSEEDVRSFIMDRINFYKINLTQNDEYNKILTDVNNYKIKAVCDWSDEFIDYLGEVYDIYRDVVHKKWLINNQKD